MAGRAAHMLQCEEGPTFDPQNWGPPNFFIVIDHHNPAHDFDYMQISNYSLVDNCVSGQDVEKTLLLVGLGKAVDITPHQ